MLRLKKAEDTLFFLTLLFLPTQLGKHFWPNFSYIYSLKIDYLSPTVYFWDILVIGLLIIWIWQKPKTCKQALNIFLFFLFTQVLSLLGANNIGAGIVRLEQYGLVGLWGVFLASYDSNSLRRRIYLPIILGTAGVSLLAILQFIKGATLGLWILGERTFSITTPGIAKFDFYGMQFLRPYATFPHPNVLAGYLVISIVILKSMSVIARRETSTDVAIPIKSGFLSASRRIGMTISGITIFLTMSRTVILAGIITLAAVLKRKSIKFIILIIIILSPILFTRFFSLLNFDNLTLIRREELIGNAWQMFLQYPIFGTGLNNFIPAMAGNLLTGPSRFLQPVHNIFLLALSETGVIGLIGLVGLIGYPIKKIFNFQFSIFNLLPWFIILFLGLFDHYFLTLPQGYRLLFLVWGLSFSMLKYSSESNP